MSGLYTQGPMQGERDTTMRDLLAVVFKRKWLILLFFGVTSLVVGVKVMGTPESYSADATLMLQRDSRTSVLQTNVRAQPWVEGMESELEVAQSIPVLERARAELKEPTTQLPEGMDINLHALANSVDAVISGESNMLYIVGTAPTANEAIRIANVVSRAYVEYHAELFALPEASDFIEAQVDSTLAALTGFQGEREALRQRIGVTDVEEEESRLQNRRFALLAELDRVERSMARVNAEYEGITRFLDEGQANLPFSQTTGTAQGNSMINAMMDLRNREGDLEELRAKYTDKHPEVRDAILDVEKVRRDLRSALSEMGEVKAHELAVLGSEQRQLSGEIRGVESRLSELPALVSRLDILETRIRSASKQYETLNEMASDAAVKEVSFNDYGVEILSEARSAQRNKRGDLVRVALAPLLSLMAGIGLAFYLENLDHSLKTREDVEQHLEIPVLASFPDVDDRESTLDTGTSRTPFGGSRTG